jgi:hypothetical protein
MFLETLPGTVPVISVPFPGVAISILPSAFMMLASNQTGHQGALMISNNIGQYQ